MQLLAPDSSGDRRGRLRRVRAGEIFAGEGRPTVDPPAGSSVARRFANLDTDDNARDFAAAAPSPGSGPLATVPEPAAAGVLLWRGAPAAARAADGARTRGLRDC